MSNYILRFIPALLLLLPSLAYANGWMSESPTLKSGNLIASKELDLVSETVSFYLKQENFRTEVIYELHSNKAGFKKGRKGVASTQLTKHNK